MKILDFLVPAPVSVVFLTRTAHWARVVGFVRLNNALVFLRVRVERPWGARAQHGEGHERHVISLEEKQEEKGRVQGRRQQQHQQEQQPLQVALGGGGPDGDDAVAGAGGRAEVSDEAAGVELLVGGDARDPAEAGARRLGAASDDELRALRKEPPSRARKDSGGVGGSGPSSPVRRPSSSGGGGAGFVGSRDGGGVGFGFGGGGGGAEGERWDMIKSIEPLADPANNGALDTTVMLDAQPAIDATNLVAGAKKAYEQHYAGLMDYRDTPHNSGMTVLEELIDAAFKASDTAARGPYGDRVAHGAALITTGAASTAWASRVRGSSTPRAP